VQFEKHLQYAKKSIEGAFKYPQYRISLVQRQIIADLQKKMWLLPDVRSFQLIKWLLIKDLHSTNGHLAHKPGLGNKKKQSSTCMYSKSYHRKIKTIFYFWRQALLKNATQNQSKHYTAPLNFMRCFWCHLHKKIYKWTGNYRYIIPIRGGVTKNPFWQIPVSQMPS
jgi:hypothetical protein